MVKMMRSWTLPQSTRYHSVTQTQVACRASAGIDRAIPRPPIATRKVVPVVGTRHGKPHREHCIAGYGTQRDVALVLCDDDAVGDVEAQPAPLAYLLGGEERLEDAGLDLRRDSKTVVADLDHRILTLLARANAQLTFAIHGVDGVVDQIGPDLVQFGASGGNSRQRAIVVPHD